MRHFLALFIFILSTLAIADCCQFADYDCSEEQERIVLEYRKAIEADDNSCHCKAYCFGSSVLENINLSKFSYYSFFLSVSYPEEEANEKFIPFLIVKPPIVVA